MCVGVGVWGVSVCVGVCVGVWGEGEPDRPRGCEKGGEWARAPGQAVGAVAAAAEKGGGSRPPDPIPLLSSDLLPARPPARAALGGPSRAPPAESQGGVAPAR